MKTTNFCTQKNKSPEKSGKFRSIRRMILLLILLMPVSGFAQKSPVDKLFEKYANKSGFTTVNISGALLGFAGAMAPDSNSTEKEILSNLNGVRILTVDDEELNKSLNFYEELESDGFFKNNDYEVLMEVTEESEVVRFYGRTTNDGKLSEMLLIVGGDDNTLISIQGLIDPKNISKVTGALDIDLGN